MFHLSLFGHILIDHFSDPGRAVRPVCMSACACVRVIVFERNYLFDLDILRADSL